MTASQTLTKTTSYHFSTSKFAPELNQAASKFFPLQDMVSHVGITDIDNLSMEEILSNQLQSLNSMHHILSVYAFSGLGEVDKLRGPLSLEMNAGEFDVNASNLQVRASNGQKYFCANIKAIRQSVEALGSIIYGNVEDYTRALQKSLVSMALQNGKPVLFVQELMEESDKDVLCKAESFVRSHATPSVTRSHEIMLARKGQSHYTLEDVKNPYYPMS